MHGGAQYLCGLAQVQIEENVSRSALLGLVVTMVVSLGACTSPPSSSTLGSSTTTTSASTKTTIPSSSTQQIVFNPFVPAGPGPGITIGFKTTGHCQGSLADSTRTDAYRCFLDQNEPNGGNIEDPCFSNPYGGGGYLLCFSNPSDLAAVEVQPTAQLTPNTPALEGDPWSLKLVDGQTCSFITGATGAVGNMRLNYGCPNGELFGDPDQSTPLWTIYYQANGSNDLVKVGIVSAYT